MEILAGQARSAAELLGLLADMDDSELLAQEISNKGALHAITYLLRIGVTKENAEVMQRSLGRCAETVSAECRRRGIATVVDPRAS